MIVVVMIMFILLIALIIGLLYSFGVAIELTTEDKVLKIVLWIIGALIILATMLCAYADVQKNSSGCHTCTKHICK